MGGMWRVVLLAATVALAAVMVSQVASAQEGRVPEGFPSVNSRDFLGGSDRSEVIRGTAGVDIIFGYGGDDEIYGFRATDLLLGGRGEDKLGGGRRRDYLYGDRGADVITGAGGSDRVYGGRGNDDLYAAFRPNQPVPPNSPARTDVVVGEAGNDFIDAADASGARDYVRCGEGTDTVVANREDRVGSGCERVRRTR